MGALVQLHHLHHSKSGPAYRETDVKINYKNEIKIVPQRREQILQVIQVGKDSDKLQRAIPEANTVAFSWEAHLLNN